MGYLGLYCLEGTHTFLSFKLLSEANLLNIYVQMYAFFLNHEEFFSPKVVF